MAMPALMFELETPVEERVARLEANVEHIRSDISDIKIDVRRLGDKIDTVDRNLTTKIDAIDLKLTDKIDAADQRLSGRIDGLKDSVMSLALTMEKSFAALKIGRALDRVWWLLMSGALLGVMARAFKCI
jgi:hypothetical protein